MGADGHIDIWRAEEVAAAFLDAEELFSFLPSHYLHELDGKQYHHCYYAYGTGGSPDWKDTEDWYVFKSTIEKDPTIRDRLRTFTEWLATHKAAEWEVWT